MQRSLPQAMLSTELPIEAIFPAWCIEPIDILHVSIIVRFFNSERNEIQTRTNHEIKYVILRVQ